MSDLEQRIRRLEDLEAIRQLKYRYCALCDRDYDPDGLAPLFAEDAVWDGGVMGRYEGRVAIREFFSGASQAVPFAIHHATNPILDIDGDRATGQWYLWQPMVSASGNTAMWMGGRYDDRYRREDGAWLFEEVTVTLRLLSPYDEGWARVRLAELPT